MSPMKRFIYPALLMMLCLNGCGGGGSGAKADKVQPLNLTIFVDLSDRLKRDNVVPSQMERDTAIINFIIDRFVDVCVEQHIVSASDRMRVLFYPTPTNGAVVKWAADLSVDMSATDRSEKKLVLRGMKAKYDASLANIYNEALAGKEFPGCDIWGFFSNKKVDVQCRKAGYRNVLVILTDGYLYHESNKVKEGAAYSYVLPQTLKVPNSSLIVRRTGGLEDLEVLVLEVNPYATAERDRLLSVLETWFSEMGVGKTCIVETDILSNVKPYIEAFLK